MRSVFPPGLLRVSYSTADWQRIIDEYFFPVGPFEFVEGWVTDDMDIPYWKLFKNSHTRQKYKYCDELTLGDRILVEPFDDAFDSILQE